MRFLSRVQIALQMLRFYLAIFEKDGVKKQPKTDVRPVIIAIGSEVLCQFKGVWFSGVVVEKNLTGTQFQVEFDRYGRTTTRWLAARAVRLKD